MRPAPRDSSWRPQKVGPPAASGRPCSNRRSWRGRSPTLLPPDHDFDGLIVDLDGVVWIGPAAVPGSVDAIAELRARGVRLVFLTNDPRGSRAEYAARLEELGIPADES